jgi:hypothetical protein
VVAVVDVVLVLEPQLLAVAVALVTELQLAVAQVVVQLLTQVLVAVLDQDSQAMVMAALADLDWLLFLMLIHIKQRLQLVLLRLQLWVETMSTHLLVLEPLHSNRS